MSTEEAQNRLAAFHHWILNENEAAIYCAVLEALGFCQNLTRAEIFEALYVQDGPSLAPAAELLHSIDCVLRVLALARFATIHIGQNPNESPRFYREPYQRARTRATFNLTQPGLKLAHWVIRNPGNHWPPNEVLLPERRRSQE